MKVLESIWMKFLLINPIIEYGWTCNQLTSNVDGGITGSRLRWSILTYVRPHNPATGFRPPSATMVSAEPFSHGTGTLWCTQKENGDLQTLICVLVARPRRCLTLSNPVPWRNWMAVYLGYTLRMKTMFRGWPVMVHDMHTRRRTRNSAASQLTSSHWLPTSVRPSSVP